MILVLADAHVIAAQKVTKVPQISLNNPYISRSSSNLFLSKVTNPFRGFFLILTENLSAQDSIGRIVCVPLKRANDIIGQTTEEMVMRAQQASTGS